MKRIPLTKGYYATVDDEDFAWLSQWKWYADCKNRTTYAARQRRKQQNGVVVLNETIYMHNQVLETPKGLCGDHVDHNGLNNQKENLRIVTRSQNSQRMRKQCCRTTSKYKGVFLDRDRWLSHIHFNGRQYNLGRFDEEEDAAIVYDVAAQLCFGEFALLNFSIPNLPEAPLRLIGEMRKADTEGLSVSIPPSR